MLRETASLPGAQLLGNGPGGDGGIHSAYGLGGGEAYEGLSIDLGSSSR